MENFCFEWMERSGSGGGGTFNTEKDNEIIEIINKKNKLYIKNAKFYKFLYYVTRFIVGLSAGLLPFLLDQSNLVVTILSIIIVISTIFDIILNPKGRWELYSKASDLLVIASLKREGKYTKKDRELFDIIFKTESSQFSKLVDLNELTKIVRDIQK